MILSSIDIWVVLSESFFVFVHEVTCRSERVRYVDACVCMFLKDLGEFN